MLWRSLSQKLRLRNNYFLSSQKIRRKRVNRKGFFQDILSLAKYILFDGWQHLIDFMLGNNPVLANSS